MSRVLGVSLLVLLSAQLAGCGAGLVGVILGISAATSRGENQDSATVVSDINLSETRTSPATLSFVLSDPESDPADLEIRYASAARRGMIARLEGLATSPRGTRHAIQWDFARELGVRLT